MTFTVSSLLSKRLRPALLVAGAAALALALASGAVWLIPLSPDTDSRNSESGQAELPEAQVPASGDWQQSSRVRLRHAVRGAEVRAWRLGRPLATRADWSTTTDSRGGFALESSAHGGWHLLAARGGIEMSAAAGRLSMRGTLRGFISDADLARGAALSPLTDFAWFFSHRRLGASLLKGVSAEALVPVLDEFSEVVAGSSYSDLVRLKPEEARTLIDDLGLMAGLAPSVYGGGFGGRDAFYDHLWRTLEARREGRGRILRRGDALILEAPAEQDLRLVGIYAEDGLHLLFSVVNEPGEGLVRLDRDGDGWLLRLAGAELIRSGGGSTTTRQQGEAVSEWRWNQTPPDQIPAGPPGFFDSECVVFDPVWEQCTLVEAEDFHVVAVPPSLVAGAKGEGLLRHLRSLLPHLGQASEILEGATELWPRIQAAREAQVAPGPQLQIAGFRPVVRALHYGDLYVLVVVLPKGAAAGSERRLEVEMLPAKAGEAAVAWQGESDRPLQLRYTAPEGAAVIAIAREPLLADDGPENRQVEWRLHQQGYREIQLAAVLTHFHEAPEAAPLPEAVAGSRKVSLSWPAVARAHSYLLHWSRSDGKGQGQIPVAAPGHRHEGLENGVEYSYWLNAVNALGLGDVSDDVVATPLAEDDPRKKAKSWYGNFLATQKRYDEKVSGGEKCRQLYGESVRLADWQDLASFHDSGDSQDFDQFLSRLFVHGYRAYRLSYSGEQTYRFRDDRPRRFFVARFDHSKPGYFFAHADISDHLLTLGSWYGSWRFLCLAPEAKP